MAAGFYIFPPMERLLELLIKGAEPALTPRADCACYECRKARQQGMARGPCAIQKRRLAAFLSQRLRLEFPRGAGVLGRLAEDARRYARMMAATRRAGLEPARPPSMTGWERPITSFPIESES